MPHKNIAHHLQRTTKKLLYLLVACLVILLITFVYTQPILAPGAKNDDLKSELEVPGSSSGESFNPNEYENINPKVGEGVKADSYLIFEESTNKVLASRQPNTAVAIASITKIMTALVTQKYGNLEDIWAINAASTNSVRPTLGLQMGDRVTVKDLANAMLIGSANDSATALGAYISAITKKSVVELMNSEAKLLGMNSTHYENPIGFDSEQNYSTANDLRLLLNEVLHIPLFTDVARKQSYSFTSETGRFYSVKATNVLVAEDSEVYAIKTGFTNEAQGAMITSIHHNNQKFIIIVLSSTDREEDTRLLKKNLLEQLNAIGD